MGTEALRNWRFEGSNDGQKWTVIMEHKNDDKLKGRGQIATWTISPPNNKHFYSKFRIYMTGTNSNGQHYLALSGFEVYGTLDALPTKPPSPQQTHKYAIIELSNSSNDAINAMLGMTGMSVEAPEYCLEEYLYKAPPTNTNEADQESSVEAPNIFKTEHDEEDESNTSDEENSSQWETECDDDDDQDHDEDEEKKKTKKKKKKKKKKEETKQKEKEKEKKKKKEKDKEKDKEDDMMQYVTDPIVSQLEISNFTELSDESPIKHTYLINKFLTSFKVEKPKTTKPSKPEQTEEDTKLDKTEAMQQNVKSEQNEEPKEEEQKKEDIDKEEEKKKEDEVKIDDVDKQENNKKKIEDDDKHKNDEIVQDEKKEDKEPEIEYVTKYKLL